MTSTSSEASWIFSRADQCQVTAASGAPTKQTDPTANCWAICFQWLSFHTEPIHHWNKAQPHRLQSDGAADQLSARFWSRNRGTSCLKVTDMLPVSAQTLRKSWKVVPEADHGVRSGQSRDLLLEHQDATPSERHPSKSLCLYIASDKYSIS